VDGAAAADGAELTAAWQRSGEAVAADGGVVARGQERAFGQDGGAVVAISGRRRRTLVFNLDY
jgi:hypothetical protein